MPIQISMTTKEKVRITVSPDAPLDPNVPLRLTTPIGDVTFELDPEDPLSFFVVSATPGQSEVLVEADAKPGEEERIISDTIEVAVESALATTLGLSASAPEPK